MSLGHVWQTGAACSLKVPQIRSELLTSFRKIILFALRKYCNWWVTKMRGLFFSTPQIHLWKIDKLLLQRTSRQQQEPEMRMEQSTQFLKTSLPTIEPNNFGESIQTPSRLTSQLISRALTCRTNICPLRHPRHSADHPEGKRLRLCTEPSQDWPVLSGHHLNSHLCRRWQSGHGPAKLPDPFQRR